MNTAQERTSFVRKEVKELENKTFAQKMDTYKSLRETIAQDAAENVKFLQALRQGKVKNLRQANVSIWQFLKEKYHISEEMFWDILGMNPDSDSKERFFQTGDIPDGMRWIYAEIILAAIEAGFQEYIALSDLIGNTFNVGTPDVRVPFIPISNSTPVRIGEGQRIPVANMQFLDKRVTAFKHGIGLETSYEAMQFSSINLANKFLADVGRNLAAGLITEAIDTAIGGEIIDLAGNRNIAASAPVIGVANTTNGFVYIDMLDVFLATSQFDRATTSLFANREQAKKILNVPEIKGGDFSTSLIQLSTKPALSAQKQLFAHEAVPANKILLLNRPNALGMLRLGGLMVETDKIIANQMNETYVTAYNAIFKMNLDAAIVVSTTNATSENGFAIEDHPSINPATRLVRIKTANQL